MSELPITLEQQTECVEREIRMRRRVYDRWVAQGKLTEKKAAHELAAMQAVRDSLDRLRALEMHVSTLPHFREEDVRNLVLAIRAGEHKGPQAGLAFGGTDGDKE